MNLLSKTEELCNGAPTLRYKLPVFFCLSYEDKLLRSRFFHNFFFLFGFKTETKPMQGVLGQIFLSSLSRANDQRLLKWIQAAGSHTTDQLGTTPLPLQLECEVGVESKPTQHPEEH
jgi:hypothetical protein